MALQNLVVALPVEVWGGATKLATIFSSLLALLETGSQFLAPSSVLGPLLVVGKRMSMEGGNVRELLQVRLCYVLLNGVSHPLCCVAHHTIAVGATITAGIYGRSQCC